MTKDLELSPAIAAYAAKLRGLDLPPAGGRIRGPGTAKTDSVRATIAETGETIKVSNKERVVSAEQDALLNAIAQGAGYPSLDAMFADFSMPVGPKVKDGKRHAADGMAPEPDEPKPVTSTASNNQPQEGRIQAAIAAPPTLAAGGRTEALGGLTINPSSSAKINFADDSQAGLNSRLAAMQKENGGLGAVTASMNNDAQKVALSQELGKPSSPVAGALSGTAAGLTVSNLTNGKPNYADDSQAGLNTRLAAMQAANGGTAAVTAQYNNAEQTQALSRATTSQNPLIAGLSEKFNPAQAGSVTSKPGRDASGVITADSAKAAYGNDMQRPGGVFGTMDMAGVNGILERENKARGEMIDLSIKANGGNGIAAPQENSADAQWNAAFDQRRMVEGMQDAMRKAGTRTERAALGQAMNTMLNNQIQQRGQDMNYAAQMAQQGLTARGQDIGALSDANRNAVTMRGQDIGAQGQRDNYQLSAIRTGLDMERFVLEKTAAQRQQAASDALIKATASGDPAAIAQARQAATAAGLKVEPAPNLQHVETDRGQMAFNPQTGKMTPVTAPDGTPIGGARALTEFQGKATGFGMRADAASQIIEQVGQNGKVQPSLIKRAAEAVPLVGEGLGMAANALQTPEQQQVEQAQRDFVNAVLRQESGAAISQGEFDNARKQYFPQPNDTPEVIAQKAANRAAAINGFRVSAGPGAKHIGGATPAKTEPAKEARQAQDQQQSGAPKVGTVDGKHVFLGGNPADPSSWAEVR